MSSNNDVIFIDDDPRYDNVSLTLTSGNNLFPDGGLHPNGEPSFTGTVSYGNGQPSFTGTVSLTTSTLPDPLDSYSNVVMLTLLLQNKTIKRSLKCILVNGYL